MFQPFIPLNGLGGLKFLQATFDRQMESFTRDPQHARDVEQLREKLARPIDLETFLDDRQLLRVSLTSHGLAGEEWKRGFIEKVLNEASDPDSNFLQRLNNPAYTAFAETFAPTDGTISLTPDQIDEIVRDFDRRSFEVAVGDVDSDLRLSLNFEGRIGELLEGTTSEDAGLFRILGDVPIRTVLETALGLPDDLRRLPIDQQASVLKDRLFDRFNISDLSQLAQPEIIQSVVERFHALRGLSNGTVSSGSANIALTILSGSGLGGQASQNLLFSRLG